jgi:dCTP deaminase
MILTDREIGLALATEEIIIAPRPPTECISSSAVDLTLAGSGLAWSIQDGDPVTFELRPGFKISSIVKFQKPVSFAPYRLEPKQFVLGWTAEKIKIPVKSRLAARVEGKSQLARLGIGVHINAPTVHAGFPSENSPPQPLQLEIFNYSSMTYTLFPGLRICQLIIEQTMGTPNTGYEGQFSIQGPQ